MLATLGGCLALLLGIAVLVLPLLTPELSRPRDSFWGAVVLLLGLVLVTSAERLTGAPMLAVLCGGLLIGRLSVEVGRGRWNQLSEEEQRALATPQRWVTGLTQLGASLARLLEIGQNLVVNISRWLAERRQPRSTGKRWVRPEAAAGPASTDPESRVEGEDTAEPAPPPLAPADNVVARLVEPGSSAAGETAAPAPAVRAASPAAAPPASAAAVADLVQPPAQAAAAVATPAPSVEDEGHEPPVPVAAEAALVPAPVTDLPPADGAAPPTETAAAHEVPDRAPDQPPAGGAAAVGEASAAAEISIDTSEPPANPAQEPAPAPALGNGTPLLEEVDVEILDPPPPQRTVPDFHTIDALLEDCGALSNHLDDQPPAAP